MAQLNGIPVYSITFNEDLEDKTGLGFISTVDYPAIEKNFVALSKQPLKFNFSQDRQMLYGPILIPELAIYRYDEKLGEYYVKFSKEVIEKLVRKFQAQQKTINLNYQHQPNSQIEGAVIQEIWLTGKPDKSESLGYDLPEGSAFIAAHIGNKEFWEKEIKSGNVMGFSIEGYLDMEMKKLQKTIIMDSKFITAKTDQGVEIKSDSETFTTGAEVYTEVEGKKTPLATGDYTLENGSVLKVTDGKIIEVVEAEMTDQEAEAVIQKAMKPALDALEAKFNAALKEKDDKITELETKLSNLPGKTPPTEPKKPAVKTKIQMATHKLGILRKKSTEVTTKK